MNKRGAIALGAKGFLKRIHDSAWAWDLFQGPVYNRLIFKAAADYFDALIRLAGRGAPARILDVGSGAGVMSLRLAQAHPEATVVGIDYALMQVRAAKRLKKKKQIHNCSFQQGNAMALPFAEAAFDRVVSVNSIKHWPDPVRGLSEIRRVLCPRGQAFISEADRSASPEALLAFSENYRAVYLGCTDAVVPEKYRFREELHCGGIKNHLRTGWIPRRHRGRSPRALFYSGADQIIALEAYFTNMVYKS